ncbi:MAG TPA: CPBP family intramembrane glutamic endopeptidase [Solirubrobacteraceae bacterium]|jgi:membrane protease YdiL (CAAX protease family)|nr:CPBP family intramembrane glutamic endopeptidase [Solirubrobacteraceae bacterium]
MEAEVSREGDPRRSPELAWPVWSAPVALLGALVVATLGGLVIDIPAALVFGVKLSSSNFPPGLSIADTVVQDIGFVVVAVYCAQLGGRAVRSWQFGLRTPGAGWGRATRLIVGLLIAFIALTAAWVALVHPGEEKTLEQLGSNEGAVLLVLSAALTCVVAPICEELLFRGYIFTALRNWRGTLPAAAVTGLLFGGVHVESAPVLDLVPLAALGFGLCLLYRYTGSLYPCMIAHSLNNSIAFAGLEGWGWQAVVLMGAALAGIWLLVVAFKRIGLITPAVTDAAAGLARPGA